MASKHKNIRVKIDNHQFIVELQKAYSLNYSQAINAVIEEARTRGKKDRKN